MFNRVGGGGVDGEVEAGGEANCAEEAEAVFVEEIGGVDDGADGAGFNVGLAADVVDDLVAHPKGIEEQAVDGEVAAFGVFLGGGEADGGWVAAVVVAGIG